MPSVFQINGIDPATLGLSGLTLRFENQQADTLQFTDQTAAWDEDFQFGGWNSLVTLTRDGTTVFKGRIRQMPRFIGAQAESIAYTAAGPWDWLERIAYLQAYKVSGDPTASDGALVIKNHGCVVLAQADDGTKIALSTALTLVINYAITAGCPITLGTISGLGSFTIPWDQAVDLSCAAAITRLLQWAPDAVVWFDYSTANPTINIARRSALSPVELSIAPEGTDVADFGGEGYTPFESIRMTPRYDLVPPAVVLFFRRNNTANAASWETLETQASPGGSTGLESGAIVRTIELAGSRFTSTLLEQRTEVIPIPSQLTLSGPVTSGSDFANLKDFWARRQAWLNDAGISITSFSAGARTLKDGSAVNVACAYELFNGQVTDWMEDRYAVVSQEQVVSVRVKGTRTVDGIAKTFDTVITTNIRAVNYTGPTDVTDSGAPHYNPDAPAGTKSKVHKYTPPPDSTAQEETPAGLADQVMAGLSTLHHDGDFALVELEATLVARPGVVINLTGGRSEWSTMAALVQAATVDIDAGRTSLVVGPPRQLGPDDLVQLYRSNRTRKDVTSAYARATGKTAP